jgi:hypothetical protein
MALKPAEDGENRQTAARGLSKSRHWLKDKIAPPALAKTGLDFQFHRGINHE